MKQSSRVAMLAAFPLLAFILMMHPHGQKHDLLPPNTARLVLPLYKKSFRLKLGVSNMTNVQIQIGGAAVNVPVNTAGSGPGPILAANSQLVITTSTGTVVVPAQSVPAGTGSVTVAGLLITNTGATAALAANGLYYYGLTIQALSNATAGIGLVLVETPIAPATTANAYTLFDIVASVPAAPAAPVASNVMATSAQVAIPALAGGAVSYNLQRAQDNAGTPGAYNTISAGVVPGATYPDNTLTQLTGYYYRLQAVNAQGTTPGAATPLFTTPRSVPTTETASVFRGSQLIMEATPGTMPPGATPKRLTQSQIIVIPKPTPKPYKPMGMKGISVVQQGSETTDAKLTGVLSYTELPYLLESALKKSAAPTQVGALAYTRVYNVQARNPEAFPQTYTVETGSSQGADRFAFGFMKGLSIKTTKKDATIDGDMVGWPLQDNVTITPGATDVAKVPVDPSTIGIYIGDDPTNLSRLVTPLDTTFDLLSHWQEQEYQNDTNNSFDGVLEVAPNFGFKITVVAGSQAFMLLSRLRTGQSIYVGMRARGPVIETAVGGAVVSQHGLDAILPCKVTNTPGRQDTAGAWTHQYEFALADDSVFGAGKITITNTLVTL